MICQPKQRCTALHGNKVGADQWSYDFFMVHVFCLYVKHVDVHGDDFFSLSVVVFPHGVRILVEDVVAMAALVCATLLIIFVFFVAVGGGAFIEFDESCIEM